MVYQIAMLVAGAFPTLLRFLGLVSKVLLLLSARTTSVATKPDFVWWVRGAVISVAFRSTTGVERTEEQNAKSVRASFEFITTMAENGATQCEVAGREKAEKRPGFILFYGTLPVNANRHTILVKFK
jgi:hypothetical protein